MKNSIKLLLVLSVFMGGLAQAQDEGLMPQDKFYYAGLGLGFGSVTSDGGGSFFTYSVRIGRDVYRHEYGTLALGIHYGTLQDKETVSGIEVKERMHAFMIEALARQLWQTGFYAGLRGGYNLVKVKLTQGATSINGSDSGGVWGPVVGFEFPINPQVSINADLSWLKASGGELAFPATGARVRYESSSAVLIQGGATIRW